MPAAFEGYMPSRWVTCTPSDATDLTGSLGLYVGGVGNVSARTLNDPSTTVIFTAVPVGTFIPGNFTRVMAATTATAILVAFA
ncbi:MAG: spike base protein, RCAP_Rcc01079 family [Paracoccaceae bacterium]